jgi:two-component system response regulator PilR (NtrC family)
VSGERKARSEQRRILIVDDEADIRELLDLTMARMGLAADCAADLGSARQLLAENEYHLCLTDMRLPDGDMALTWCGYISRRPAATCRWR